LVDPLLLNSLDAFGATFLLVVMEPSFSCLSTTRPQVPDSQCRQGAIRGFQQQPHSVAGPCAGAFARSSERTRDDGTCGVAGLLVCITSSRPTNPTSYPATPKAPHSPQPPQHPSASAYPSTSSQQTLYT
jgi:hypothetical protein